jgi:hypothetical protein
VKKAIAQDTLAALVETGAAREFRALRDGESLAPGTAPRRQVATNPLPARTDALLALTDRRRAFLRRGGDQGADRRDVIRSTAPRAERLFQQCFIFLPGKTASLAG